MGKPTGKGWIGNVIKAYHNTPDGKSMFELGEPIHLDFTSTFVGFVGGARGSGKSYCTNVIIEELLKNNPTLGLIAIDKPGLYFSLKYPNDHTEEFRGWNNKVKPKSYADRVRVLVPIGWKDRYPEKTYDGVIGIRPSQLTAQNWFDCLQIEATKPQGVVLSIFLKKVVKLNPNFTIQQLVSLVDRVVEVEQNPDEAEDDIAKDVLNEFSFHRGTVEALQSKLMAATTWGIFSSKSMDIYDICQPGILTIIDISWWQIPYQVGALLVAFLTEQLFGLRMMKSQEAMHAVIGEDVKYLQTDKKIPPPVLIIEEAQNYLASKSSDTTFSVNSLRRYVRQGRQAGCSLIFITQQPQAIDTGPLSQVDWVLQLQLTHNADLKAVKDIMPCELPRGWQRNIRGLKIGEALFALRGSVYYQKVKVRPRETIHLARTETTDMFQLREDYAKTESDTLVPIEPPVVIDGKNATEVQRLLTEMVSLRHQFQAMKSEKNDLIKEKEKIIKQKEDEVNELSIKLSDLQRIVNTEVTLERHGIMIAKFDQEYGYIPDYETTSGQIDSKLIRDVARSAIGFGETLSTLKFKLDREVDYYCFSRRFSKEDVDARGGHTSYALVIFSTDKDNDYPDELLNRIADELLKDWRNRTSIIDKYFAQIFYSIQGLRKAIDLYKLELEQARKRIRSLTQKNKDIPNIFKNKIVQLEKEKHLLAVQIENMSSIFDLEKPEVRSILMEEKYEELKTLSKELAEVKVQLEEETKKHTRELEEAKQTILDLDRDIESAEIRGESRAFEDFDIERRLEELRYVREGGSLPAQQQIQQEKPFRGQDIIEALDGTKLRPIIDQMFQEEREKHVGELRDRDEAIKLYRNGLTKIRNNINNFRRRSNLKVLEHEQMAVRIMKYSKHLEREIDYLKKTVRDLRPKPIETIDKEDRTHLFSEEIVPKEVARALNQDAYPEHIQDIAQGIKKQLTNLEPLAYKIMTVLETVDTWVVSRNLDLVILDWGIGAIRKRLAKLIKNRLVIQKRDGQNILYRSNLKRLVNETFHPYRAVLTGFQIDELYMDIRNCLPIQLIPHVKSNGTNSTLTSFIEPQDGEYDPVDGEIK